MSPQAVAGSDSEWGFRAGLGGDCRGLQRAYFELAVPSVIWGTRVARADIDVVELFAAQCSMSSRISLDQTGPIAPTTSWSHQPARLASLGSTMFRPACDGPVRGFFDVTALVQRAADERWGSVTVALVNDSPDRNEFKRFSSDPLLLISYSEPVR